MTKLQYAPKVHAIIYIMNKTPNTTILTGLRVNSEFTLGNFLGALIPMVRLANRYSGANYINHVEDTGYSINIFVPDLHSIISE